MTTKAQPQTMTQPGSRGVSAFFSEVSTLYIRAIKKLLRRPVVLYFSLVQPMVWLLLFGQVFGQLTRRPELAPAFGGTSYFQFFMPAVILQTILFGAAQSGIGLIADMDSGFLDKLLTTPINRMAILLGKVLGDLTRMIVQAIIIIAVTWIVGQLQTDKVHYVYGLAGIIGALAVGLLFGIGLAGLMLFIAIRTRDTQSTFLIANFFTLPLLFTSSAQLPRSLLPTWLQAVAHLNPVTYTIDAMRILLNGPQTAFTGRPREEILTALIILTIIAVVTMTLSVRSFRRTIH